MYTFTATFISDRARNSCGIDSLATLRKRIETSAAATMNRALRMLLAAITRPACFVGARLDQGVQRYDDVEAPKMPMNRMSVSTPRSHGGAAPPASRRAPRLGNAAGVPPEEDAEDGQADRAERHQADLHLATGKLRTASSPAMPTENTVRIRSPRFVAVQPFLGEGRDLRQVDCAEETRTRSCPPASARDRRALAEPQAEDAQDWRRCSSRASTPAAPPPLRGMPRLARVAAGGHQHHRGGHRRRVMRMGISTPAPMVPGQDR